MLRKVYLEGEIADRYGSEFEMDVSTFGEAIRCFEANFSDFKNYLVQCHEKGIGFTCQVGEKKINEEDELLYEYEEGDMVISAVPAGSKSAISKIITGIILIIIGYLIINNPTTWGPTIAIGGKSVSVIGLTAMAIGINLTMMGIQQMLMPDPSVDSPDQDESYLFQGAGQTILEGDPVPILYGRLRVPGRPITFDVKNANRYFVHGKGVNYQGTDFGYDQKYTDVYKES